MTRHRSFKRRVRDRMAKTGERYSSARRHLLTHANRGTESNRVALGANNSEFGVDPTGRREGRGANRNGIFHLPGIHPETTGLRVLLANRGVTLPHSGDIPSEAMLLGIGGGIGAGVFAFHYDTFSSLFLAGRHLWQDGSAFVAGACERLGMPFETHETGGAKTAVKQLEAALESGPALAWLDVTRLSHRGNSGRQDEGSYHAVTVYALENDEALLGDLAPEPIRVTADDLAAARARNRKFKHRLLTLGDPTEPIDLEGAIRQGLRACVDGFDSAAVGGYKRNFRLDAFEELADNLLAEGKRGWRTMFPRGRRLWSALLSLYRFIEHEGSGGGLMRPLYADFLAEAAEVLDDDAVGEAAEHYRRLGASWSELALEALPDDASLLTEARILIDGSEEMYFEQSGAAEELLARREQIRELGAEAEKTFPLDSAATDALLANLERGLRNIHRLESDGLTLLRRLAAS